MFSTPNGPRDSFQLLKSPKSETSGRPLSKFNGTFWSQARARQGTRSAAPRTRRLSLSLSVPFPLSFSVSVSLALSLSLSFGKGGLVKGRGCARQSTDVASSVQRRYRVLSCQSLRVWHRSRECLWRARAIAKNAFELSKIVQSLSRLVSNHSIYQKSNRTTRILSWSCRSRSDCSWSPCGVAKRKEKTWKKMVHIFLLRRVRRRVSFPSVSLHYSRANRRRRWARISVHPQYLSFRWCLRVVEEVSKGEDDRRVF